MKTLVIVFIMSILINLSHAQTTLKKQPLERKKPTYTYDISYAEDMAKLNQLAEGHDLLCWAYSATMLFSWRYMASYPVDYITDWATKNSQNQIDYNLMYKQNKGIPWKYIGDFGNAMGWRTIISSPGSVGLYDLLYYKGPLFFAHNPNPADQSGNGHLMVIIGIKSNDLKNNDNTWLEYFDPWGGNHDYMSFNEYATKYTSLRGPAYYLFYYPE